MFDRSQKYLVALSGGADSVALLLVLKALDINIEAVTCNFKLRGEESNRDEDFCIRLCLRKKIKLHKAHFDTIAYAKLHKVSIEMAARDLRYSYFENLRAAIKAKAICVAHHKDDNIETVLMNIVRGTGLHGLKGIMPKNENVIRPLLNVNRKDIEDFLHEQKQDYVTDSTNLKNDILRNKIRLDLLPLMETIYPSARENINQMSNYIKEASLVYDSAIKDAIGNVFSNASQSIDLEELMETPSPECTLYHILNNFGFSSKSTNNIFKYIQHGGFTSGSIWYSDTYQLLADRKSLVLRKRRMYANKDLPILEDGIYVYNENTKFSFKTENHDGSLTISKSKFRVCVDSGKIKMPLTIRHTKTGDRFIPFGMKGSKLISDFLTDQKSSLFEKKEQLVVCDASEKILWVVGKRIDNRFRITGQTKKIMWMESYHLL